MLVVTVSSRGRVSIPAEVRSRLGIVRGTRLQVEVRDARIVLTPIPEDGWRALRGALRGEGSLTTLLEEERRREEDRPT